MLRVSKLISELLQCSQSVSLCIHKIFLRMKNQNELFFKIICDSFAIHKFSVSLFQSEKTRKCLKYFNNNFCFLPSCLS